MHATLSTMRATRLRDAIRGAFNMTAVLANTAISGPPVIIIGMVNSLLPKKPLDRLLLRAANRWIKNNNWLIDHTMPKIDWHITLPEEPLSLDGHYLVMSNHQTWVDTTLMQYVGSERIPFLRFFTKWELIYVPIIGLCFKALDFPMMKRHSAEAIARNPALRHEDLIEAHKSCVQLLGKPFSLINYPEGTRYTEEKHQKQKSPYRYLLKPKAGGMALSLQVLAERLHGPRSHPGDGLLDITVVYPDGIPSYLDFWMGKTRRIGVDIRRIEIPEWVWGRDYQEDADFRERFQAWISEQWQIKDDLIDKMLSDFGAAQAKLINRQDQGAIPMQQTSKQRVN